MESAPNSYLFPHAPPPPPPSHPIGPPPPPAHPISPPPPPAHPISPPPPPPHIIPPPPPHVFPPPPHVFPPPPPHVTPVPPHVVPPPPSPPLPPHHHPIIIVIVIISCGGLFFLAALFALCCFLKKKKKKTEKTHDELVKFDEHLRIKEAIEEGPHGKKTVLLSVEDDVHTERIDIDKMKERESLGQENKHETSAEITPSALEEGRSSSSPKHHDHPKQDS